MDNPEEALERIEDLGSRMKAASEVLGIDLSTALDSIAALEINQEDLDLIWDLHPKEITTAGRRVIIEAVRRAREDYHNRAAKPKKPKKEKVTKSGTKPELQINIDDLLGSDAGDLI